MNEPIPTQSDSHDKRASATAPNVSVATKAQQLSRAAAERGQALRRAAVREQALREKMRRLESVEREIDRRSGSVPMADTLANLSDASWEEIKQHLDGLHQEAERYIKDNPTKSVLSAAGVGFLLGLMMKR